MKEICNEEDNNCNGEKDEGIKNKCGDCRPSCGVIELPEEEGWDMEDSDGLEDQDGNLVLSVEEQEIYYAWIANHLEGMVSKLDTRTGKEVARYISGSLVKEDLILLIDVSGPEKEMSPKEIALLEPQ
jgi:hypothetical protein